MSSGSILSVLRIGAKPHNCTLGQVTMVLLTSTFKKIKMLLESFFAKQS